MQAEKQRRKAQVDNETWFHYKLFSILEKEDFKDIIAWDAEGLRVEIKKPESLAEDVLPLFFTHKKLASFTRQLNFYGFKSHREANGRRMYFHPLFRKGDRLSLSKIVRNKPNNSKSRSIALDSPDKRSCPLRFEIDELMDELRSATLLIENLREENLYLRRQVKKYRFSNNTSFSYENEALSEHFPEFSSIPASNALRTITSFTYKPNERAIHPISQEAQLNPINFRSIQQMESPVANFGASEEQADRSEENKFLLMGDKRFF
jgi:hypothetical protein